MSLDVREKLIFQAVVVGALECRVGRTSAQGRLSHCPRTEDGIFCSTAPLG